MKKVFLIAPAAIFAAVVVSSCSGKDSGPAEEVLSKKAYATVVAKYPYIHDFIDGVCIVSEYVFSDYGAINTKGEEIIPLRYNDLNDPVEGRIIAEDEDGKYGVFDTKGRQVVPFEYDFLEDYSCGLSRFGTGGYLDRKYGYIDLSGKVKIEAKYDDAAPQFKDGLAYVNFPDEDGNNKYGFIDTDGKEVIPPMYENAHNFSDGMAMVRTKKGYGYINTKGEFFTSGKYDRAEDFSDGLAVVEYNDKVSVIDKTGTEKFTFSKRIVPGTQYHDGLILVFDKETLKFGYYDADGEVALPIEYYAADGFRDGKALTASVKDGECLYEFINPKGKVVESFGPDDAEDYEDYKEVEDIFYHAVDRVRKVAEKGLEMKDLRSIITSTGIDHLIESYKIASDRYIYGTMSELREQMSNIVDEINDKYGYLVSDPLDEYIDSRIYE